MKVIPLSEARARLGHYARLCHDEQVVVTVSGVPAFQLSPLDENDDLIDQLLKHNPEFEKLLKNRLRERTLSTKEIARRL